MSDRGWNQQDVYVGAGGIWHTHHDPKQNLLISVWTVQDPKTGRYAWGVTSRFETGSWAGHGHFPRRSNPAFMRDTREEAELAGFQEAENHCRAVLNQPTGPGAVVNDAQRRAAKLGLEWIQANRPAAYQPSLL